MIPTAHPIVMPLPSLGHRRFCVAGLARGHPDSGGAAIMGVPLLHLVLPLSGCLCRRTPARATRGEARGHRSALAQNPLLMYPLLFPSFGLVVGLVCPRHMVDCPNVFALLWLHPVWFHPMVLLCGHVGRRRAHSTMTLTVCVVCA